ncbi:MAG: efflux RND transporter periplasmic adaptor subunit [Deltaproteobacteria bacterium]|nr:efflux RND transporter periplasmic adaptor subunit [Deltaproteobacteria bacterium]
MSTDNLTKLKISLESKARGQHRTPLFKIVFISLLVLTLVTFGAYWLWINWLRPPVEIRAIKVSVTFPSRALTILNASGYVVAQRKAAVSSKATGRLEHLYVEEGKAVKQGDIIAQLENSDLQAALEEAQASLKVSQADLNNADAELDDATLNFNRQKVLKDSGSVSEQAFDSAEARYKKAKAAYRSAKYRVDKADAAVKVSAVNLDQSYIRAPFDGVILTKSAEEGEVVAPMGASLNAKAAVVSMADMKSRMVEVDVAESSLEKVKVGGPAEIRLDAFPNDRFEGTVYMIVPTADRSKATVLAKVKFDKISEKVLPEMSAKVSFLLRPLREGENRAFLGVPTSSILKRGDADIVFSIKEGMVMATEVKTGKSWGETTEIISGLNEGELIALKPDADLASGRRVKIKE